MAHTDKTSTFELRIKVNKQNLSMFPEKNNTSMLRLPTDPSWPKLPLRRLTNSANDIIEPSCVITLAGTSTKDRILRASQYPKSDKKYELITQIPKRLPGCVDPRFKKQILETKTKKDEFCNMENNEQKTQLDKCILQNIKKVENSQGKLVNKKVDDYISSYQDTNKLLENITKSMKESSDCHVKKRSTLKMDYCTMASLCMANEQNDIKHKSFQEQKDDVKIAYQTGDIKNQENVENIYTTSILTSKSMSTFKSLTNKKCLSNGIRQYDIKSNDNISENKNALYYNKQISNWIHNKKKINLNVSLNQGIINEISVNKNHQNFNIVENINDAKNDKNTLNLNILESLRTTIERDNINSYIVTNDHIINNDIKGEPMSKEIIVENSVRPCTNIWKQEIVKNKQLIMNELSMNMRNDKMLQKCIQTLALSEVRDKKCSKNDDENKDNYRKSYISQKHKMVLLNLSRKAKSFFRKKSRLTIIDSDCTLILPGPCRIKDIIIAHILNLFGSPSLNNLE